MSKARRYSVSDGRLVLTLLEAPEGGYVVTSPMEPSLVTEAETVPEAFENARDALKALLLARTKKSTRPATRRSVRESARA
jgi:predicted RNase H-like HicB family nuclease